MDDAMLFCPHAIFDFPFHVPAVMDIQRLHWLTGYTPFNRSLISVNLLIVIMFKVIFYNDN